MNTKKILAILTFLGLFSPLAVMAAGVQQFCFQDQFGDQYLFSGGKLDKKAYMIRAHIVPCGSQSIAGNATFTKLIDGSYFMQAIIGNNVNQTCIPFQIAAAFNSTVTSGSGNYDNYPRNDTADGALTFTPIVCALVPITSSEKQDVPAGPRPGKRAE